MLRPIQRDDITKIQAAKTAGDIYMAMIEYASFLLFVPSCTSLSAAMDKNLDESSISADDGSGKKANIFETWGQFWLTVPFTTAITLFVASWGNKQGYFSPAFFPNSQTFFFITTLNFYVSVTGLVVSRVSPACARGFHFLAFLCALISLTMLFEALLPDELRALPWVFLALVLSILCGLAIYEWCFNS